MAELNPYPFDRLLTRMFRELERDGSIFDLPQSKFFLGSVEHDLSVPFHQTQASTALGPSAGPQSQLAQNIVLSWLGGSRVMELKTVQIMDELEIGRPCIDAQTVGYNIEWSQELKLAQSLEEYVKASMLIDILVASGKLELAPGFDRVVYDMSVGYDLKGIQSPPVRAFMDGMKDASAVVDRLRGQIPQEFEEYRDLAFRTQLSDSLTLSTFHGCPPEEIEKIIDFLLRELRIHCIIKLNPTLLGEERMHELMHRTMGYEDAVTPSTAFANDTKWEQMVGFVRRLGETADSLGLGLGVKFSNTLIVHNHKDFFPGTENEMYLSGQPLHVLAMNLVRDFRREFGDAHQISFSAGIDQKNFADAVALGLSPVTVCTDLLRPGGYARQTTYFQSLLKRMDAVGATDVPGFILRAFGTARAGLEQAGGSWTEEVEAALAEGEDPESLVGADVFAGWLSACKVLNTELYVESVSGDERYRLLANSKLPKKMGTKLELFNCVTCDKCIPVCPNDANFALQMPPMTIPILRATRADGDWNVRTDGEVVLDKKHQIANFADFCNECGNCDVFCPEDGGPYILKPRFFGSIEEWDRYPEHDGFYLHRTADSVTVHGRFDGVGTVLTVAQELARYSGNGFSVSFDPRSPADSVKGDGQEVDLTYALIMLHMQRALLGPEHRVNYVNA